MPRVLTEIRLRDDNLAENGKLGAINTLFHFHIDLENFQNFQRSAKARQNDSTLLKKIGLALQYKSYFDSTIHVRSILDESENGITLLLELNNPAVIEVCKITFNPKKDQELIKRLNSLDYLNHIVISNLNANENLKTIEAQDIDEAIFARNALVVNKKNQSNIYPDSYPARFGKTPRTPKRNANKKELDKEEREEALELFSSYHSEIILPLLEQQKQLAQLVEKVETNEKLSKQLADEIFNIGLIPEEEYNSSEKIDKIFKIEDQADLRSQQINDLDSVRNNLQQRKNLDDKADQSKAGLLQQAEAVLAHNYNAFHSTDACFKEIRAELVQVIHDTALQYFCTLLKWDTLPYEADNFNKRFKDIAEITFDSLRVAVKVKPNVIEYQNKAVPKLNFKNLSLKKPETLATDIQKFVEVSKTYYRKLYPSTYLPLKLFQENFKEHRSLHQYCSYENYKFTWTDPSIANLNKADPSHERLKSKVIQNQEFMNALDEKIRDAYHRTTVANNTIMPLIKEIKATAKKLKETKDKAKEITQCLNIDLEKLTTTKNRLVEELIRLNTIEESGEKHVFYIDEDIQKLIKIYNDKLEPIEAIASNLEQLSNQMQPLKSLQKAEELFATMLTLRNQINLQISFKNLNKAVSNLYTEHEKATTARLAKEQAEKERLAKEKAEKDHLANEAKRLAEEKARLDAEQAKRVELEKQRQADVIDFAEKIVCFLNQLDYWSKQVKYGGGEKIKGTNFKVPRSIKSMYDSINNFSLDTYDGAAAFIKHTKAIVDKAGNGYACCFFKTRTTNTSQFYQLIESFKIDNPNNQDFNHQFKQMNNDWDTVWEKRNNSKANNLPEITVSNIDSNPSTPRSLSRASSMSSGF